MSMLIASLLITLTMRASRAFAAHTTTQSHICTKMENYTVTSVETYVEPVVVNTFTWCLRIPPRCPKTRTEMRQRYRTKTEVKSRAVKRCCDGYISTSKKEREEDDEEENESSCVPFCVNCLAGVCVSPNRCICHPGYTGEDCSKECSPGSWGAQCMQECDCGLNVSCEATNGTCHCPSGRHGPRCADTCPGGFWGPGCSNKCQCKNIFQSCHPENGSCVSSAPSNTNFISLTISTVASHERTRNEEVTHFPSMIQHSPSEFYNHVVPPAIDDSFEITKKDGNHSPTMKNPKAKVSNRDDDSSTTVRPVIVLVSVPDRRPKVQVPKDRTKFTLQDTFLSRYEEKVDNVDTLSAKNDFIKKMQKAKDGTDATTVPLDVALIIIASIVFVSLTSIAVFAILHMRSKLLESVRRPIYHDGKVHSREINNQKQTPRISRVSTLVDNAFPQTTLRMNPSFAVTPSSNVNEATINMEAVDGYVNGGIAAVGLRISGDFRELLQGDHYDRPPTTLLRLRTDFEEEQSTEHLYDEIPLQSTPLYNRKSSS